MLIFVLQVMIGVFCVYGVFSVIQDSLYQRKCPPMEKNITLVIAVKNAENGIEEYIRELTGGKNFQQRVDVIDLESEDDTIEILHKLEKEKSNVRVFTKKEGEKYLQEIV